MYDSQFPLNTLQLDCVLKILSFLKIRFSLQLYENKKFDKYCIVKLYKHSNMQDKEFLFLISALQVSCVPS